MKTSEYVTYDAVGLADLVRRKEVTPRELVEKALELIGDVNPRINAVIDVLEDYAHERLREGLTGAFAGVPFLVKDSFELTGMRSSWGCTLAKDNVSKRTHEIARRLTASGVVPVGRTNMSELGLLPTTEPRLHGPTSNPWNLAHSPGGSSGGSAAAVAAGIVPCAHAEDGGGSIRIPASACGLWGLKPGRGRTPQEPWDAPDGFVMQGVVSRTVRDSAHMLDIISGARPFDRWQAPPVKGTFASAIVKDPKPLRIGFTTRGMMGDEAASACGEAVDAAAKLFAELGHAVEEVNFDLDGAMFAANFTTLWAMSSGYFVRAALEQLTTHTMSPRVKRVMVDPNVFTAIAWATTASQGLPPLEPMTRRLIKLNGKLTVGDHWMAWSKLNDVAQPLYDALGTYDLVLTPTLGEPPWRTGSFTLGATDEETAAKLLGYAGFTPLCNTTGLPAMNMPLSWTTGGLPIGVQLIGAHGSERILLALAAQAERATSDKRPLPKTWAGRKEKR